jgi:hypothetical protein
MISLSDLAAGLVLSNVASRRRYLVPSPLIYSNSISHDQHIHRVGLRLTDPATTAIIPGAGAQIRFQPTSRTAVIRTNLKRIG